MLNLILSSEAILLVKVLLLSAGAIAFLCIAVYGACPLCTWFEWVHDSGRDDDTASSDDGLDAQAGGATRADPDKTNGIHPQ
jgi:hypothetical protein